MLTSSGGRSMLTVADRGGGGGGGGGVKFSKILLKLQVNALLASILRYSQK